MRVLLRVRTSDEVRSIIESNFLSDLQMESFCAEVVNIEISAGRILASDIIAKEDVPGFDRSMVDGYAVKASDTFGCSESLPAVLTLAGEILMGESAETALKKGTCVSVSTGGEIPDGADAVVMHEHTEDYGNGMVGVQKTAAPGINVIFRNDDASKGNIILNKGKIVTPYDIGILAALGYNEVDVRRKPVVGVISTGDELVSVASVPKSGQVRDVNTPMLIAVVNGFGAVGKDFKIIQDDENLIRASMLQAVETCDIVLISGGSSAGARDMTAKVIESEGELFLHGIAIKPGKPTILGSVKGKPVFGLPGHPVAAFMITELFVRPLISGLTGAVIKRKTTKAKLSEAISSNHGREEYIFVKLDEKTGTAIPVKGKSGLVSGLANIGGYICIPRDCEGIAKGEDITVVFL